jgi:hypothetical protein
MALGVDPLNFEPEYDASVTIEMPHYISCRSACTQLVCLLLRWVILSLSRSCCTDDGSQANLMSLSLAPICGQEPLALVGYSSVGQLDAHTLCRQGKARKYIDDALSRLALAYHWFKSAVCFRNKVVDRPVSDSSDRPVLVIYA